MRCRVGDLAVIVGKDVHPDFLGVIVRVRNLAMRESVLGAVWDIDPRPDLEGETLEGKPVKGIDACPDAWLLPIRDNPGTDETMTWADKPEKVPA